MANLLASGAMWGDNDDAPPSTYWTGTVFQTNPQPEVGIQFSIKYSGVAASGDTYSGHASFTTDSFPPNVNIVLRDDLSAFVGFVELVDGEADFSFDATLGTRLSLEQDTGEGFAPITGYNFDLTLTPSTVVADAYNCDCDCGFPTETLAQIRTKIASLMGYSAQIADLPASVKLAILTNLNLAQSMVVNDLSEIKSDRYFSWPVEPGETKFCVYENQETCRNIMVATRVREAYFVGDGNVITRLDKGIPFQYYEAENPRSVPSRYQVRSCIEIWPPPVAAGTLVVRGTLAAVDLADDADKVVVDKDALLLRTVAFMKSAKGHADAANYMGQYWEVIGALCSDSHMDERYVPGWLPRDSRLRECLTHHMEPRTYG